MAALPVNIPMPAARPSVEPGPPALGPTLGIADGATPAAGGVEPIFFRGPAYKEKECTKVFGYIGLPAGLQPGETCPGMVLLHGGGGTAFDVWVKLWNARGYAAITFDQCGDIPSQPLFGDGAPHARHSDGGPPGWDASFRQVAEKEPLEDQWQYHAVTAALNAHTLLAAHPAVDAGRIGLTGISWGGYMTCVVAGVDPRYRFAVPVYGCGFLALNSAWSNSGPGSSTQAALDLRTEAGRQWDARWDPRHYLPHAARSATQLLWVNGTNDFAYPLDSMQKSYMAHHAAMVKDAAAAGSTVPRLCVRVEMPHSHAAGWAPKEIFAFADEVLGFNNANDSVGGLPLVTEFSTIPGANGGTKLRCVVETVGTENDLSEVELAFSRALGYWPDRRYNRFPVPKQEWKRLPANGRAKYEIIAALPVPPGVSCVAFLTLTDQRGLLCSTPHADLMDRAAGAVVPGAAAAGAIAHHGASKL